MKGFLRRLGATAGRAALGRAALGRAASGRAASGRAALGRLAAGKLLASGRVAGRAPVGPTPPRQRRSIRWRGKVPAQGSGVLAYEPHLDGDADPGEVVWTWVAYEEDPTRGKDRPVVVIGRDGDEVLGLMLSSQADRDDDPGWLALGPGAWDRQRRPSWVRLSRILRLAPDSIRREGAILDRPRFERVLSAMRRDYGWH